MVQTVCNPVPRYCSESVIHYISSPTNTSTVPAFTEPHGKQKWTGERIIRFQRLWRDNLITIQVQRQDRSTGMLWDFGGLPLFSSKAGSNPVLTLRASGCDVIVVLAKDDVQWSSWGWHFSSLHIRNGESCEVKGFSLNYQLQKQKPIVFTHRLILWIGPNKHSYVVDSVVESRKLWINTIICVSHNTTEYASAPVQPRALDIYLAVVCDTLAFIGMQTYVLNHLLERYMNWFIPDIFGLANFSSRIRRE